MRRALLAVGLLSLAAAGWAEPPSCDTGMNAIEFYRDDLANLKQHLETIVGAIGEPGAPYGRESENWSYPSGVCKDAKGYIAVAVGYNTTFSTEGQEKKLEAAYRKKMMAAQASGNYQAMAQLSQEMQQKAMGQAMANQNKSPVTLEIDADNGDGGTVDPDSVIRDGTGFIALRTSSDPNAQTERVVMYFDHVALKDAKRIANFTIPGATLVSGPHDFANVRIQLDGPKEIVESMVKKMDAGKILGALQSSYINREP